MKALSLHQPWATLVAISAKKIETRSWYTQYRGLLAIHASQERKFINMHGQNYVCADEPFYTPLMDEAARICKKYTSPLDIARRMLPRGAIVATCQLIAVVAISPDVKYTPVPPQKTYNCVRIPPEDPEKSFGDYTPGRYAWILADIQMLETPIPAKGSLGLWDWRR